MGMGSRTPHPHPPPREPLAGSPAARRLRGRWLRKAAALGAAVALLGAWPAAGARAASPGQAPPGAAAGEAPSKPGGQRLRISVVGAPPEAQTGRWDPQAGVWEFNPPPGAFVRIEWGPWEARGRSLRWYAGAQVAELSGEVSVRRPDLDASAARATVLVDARRAKLEGGARLVQYALDGEQRGRVLRTLTADVVELDDARQVAHATGSVRLEQPDPLFRANADQLDYAEGAGRLVLTARKGVSGQARGYRLDGAPRVEYDVRTGELWLYGPAAIQQVEGEPAR